MVTIAVITNVVSASGRFPFRGAQAGKGPAFWHLIRIGRRFGLEFLLARRADWDGRSRVLARAYTHDGRRWRVCRQVSFAAILPRAPLNVRRPPPIVYWNDSRVWRVCADKWLTYRRFRWASPRTWLLSSPSHLRSVRRQYPEQTFVLKPRYGRQSRGVVVLSPGKPTPQRLTEPMILQEFISGGAFLGRSGIWDIRCFVQNGQLDLTYLKRGELGQPILNAHRGTPIDRFPVSQLPASSRAFVHRIDRQFRNYRPRHYCVDFRYDQTGKPVLIELNHLPVLPWGKGSDYPKFYQHLCRIVLSALRRGKAKRDQHG